MKRASRERIRILHANRLQQVQVSGGSHGGPRYGATLRFKWRKEPCVNHVIPERIRKRAN